MKKISIIYSIFGNFDVQRLHLALLSALEQDYPNKEILVIEINKKKTFTNFDSRINHVFIRGSNMNFGEIRNIGIQKAKGDFVYINDADIIFLDKKFISSLEKEYRKDKCALIRPPRIRLLEKDFEKFYSVAKDDIYTTIAKLHRDTYVASLSKRLPKIYHFKFLKNEFTSDCPNKQVHEVSKWDVMTHYGAIFASKTQLKKAHYYSPGYIGWGNEDGDLQWKLKETSGTRVIPKRKVFTVLHLDHKKGYFNMENFDLNEAIYHYRQHEIGYKKSIALDKKNFKDYKSILTTWENASDNEYWRAFRKEYTKQKK